VSARRHLVRVIVLLVATVVCAGAATGGAAAATAHVVVVPSLDLADIGPRGAVGLFVPGAGATVSRERALHSLVRGRSISSLVEDTGGRPLIRLSTTPGRVTIYVVLPPPGSRHNDTRYPVAIVGAGYRGVLTSRSTRIHGLVSIADIAPTALALQQGRQPPIRFDAAGTVAQVRALDRRLARAHDGRTAATIALGVLIGTLTGLALVIRTPLLTRAALLAAPAAVGLGLVLSAAGVRSPAAVGWGVGLGGALLSGIGARRERGFAALVALFLTGFALVLVAWPEVNALAAIGPHPDGGARFYGVTNQVETLLLAPVLAAASTSRRAFVIVGLAALVAVGWSRAGADGGGVLVVLAGLAALALLRGEIAPTGRRVGVAVAAVAAVAGALVVLDRVAGGSSHVTRAAGSGPAGLVDDLTRRLDISWAGATQSLHTALLCLAGLAGLAVLATRSPRRAPLDAFLVGFAASLVVNDSPVDELVWGSLGAAALWAWASASERSSERRARRASSAPAPQRV